MQIKSQDERFKDLKILIHDLIKLPLVSWLSVKGTAIYSGLSESTIRRAIQSGTLKANKVGGKWLVKETWLETYLTN